MSDPSDPIGRAHLTGETAPSPPVHTYDPPPDLGPLVRRFWVPVWNLPRGEVQAQRVLQYPVCLLVVAHDYARFYGVVRGLSTVELSGIGWAVGVMLQPAAGRILLGRSVASVTDTAIDLDAVAGLNGAAVRDRIRATMATSPWDVASHRDAIASYGDSLRAHLPIDATGLLVNEIVTRVEEDPDITRVQHLASAFAMGERHLQRLTRDHLGLTPKWLIQRRRLHDATVGLKDGTVSLSALAYDLGYVDQAHFTRDYRRVTGMTPGAYHADQPGR